MKYLLGILFFIVAHVFAWCLCCAARCEYPEIEDVESYEFGDVSVDFRAYEVVKAGERLHLTPIEFGLLKLLIEHRGEVLTRDSILDETWGDVIVTDRTINTHIAHLRKKIEKDPANPEYIVGVRGVGYKFNG